VPPSYASSVGTVAAHVGDLVFGGRRAELQLASISHCTIRAGLLPVAADGSLESASNSPELAIASSNPPFVAIRSLPAARTIEWGGCRIRVAHDPAARTLVIEVVDGEGLRCQRVEIGSTGTIRFALGGGQLFGMGQGGRQFDRRGGAFPLVNGQGEGVQSMDMREPGAQAPVYEFDLAHEGARITIPWIVSTDGWAIFFQRPYGTFDLRG